MSCTRNTVWIILHSRVKLFFFQHFALSGHRLLSMCALCGAVYAPGTCVWPDVFPGLVETGFSQVQCALLCWGCPPLTCRLFTHGCMNLLEAEQQVQRSGDVQTFLKSHNMLSLTQRVRRARTFWMSECCSVI